MKTIFRIMVLLIAVGMISTVEAKTTKYELLNLSSQLGNALYPELPFYGATSAALTVTTNAPDPETKINLLEVTFPNTAKFRATNFKWIEGTKYRAYVADAWIYRELMVDVDLNVNGGPLMIQVYISDRVGFVKPPVNAQPLPPIMLFSVYGMLNDVTPTRVVDQKVLTVAGKKLILSLRDRLSLNGQFIPEGFAVDALWYGKGTKTLILPAPFGRDMFDSVEVVALVVDENTSDPMISVKFKDPSGNENASYSARLHDLLDQSYGPTQW